MVETDFCESKLASIGHIMRGDRLMKEVMELGKWRQEGKEYRYGSIGTIDELTDNERYGDLKRRAEDHQELRVCLPGPVV